MATASYCMYLIVKTRIYFGCHAFLRKDKLYRTNISYYPSVGLTLQDERGFLAENWICVIKR
jgi:hypothetical protein